MKIQSLLAAMALFTSFSSHAGVIYEWQGVKKASPSIFSMRIEFDEATVESGAYSLHVGGGDTQVRPDAGLIEIYAGYSAYRPRTEPFNRGLQFGHFDMDVNFSEGKFLTGSIHLYDFQTGLNMSTGFNGSLDSRLFTIYNTDADYGMGDCAGPTAVTCTGGTGHVRQVPEPTPIALLGLGALAAYATSRRRTAQES